MKIKEETVDRRRHPDAAICRACEARGFNLCHVLSDEALMDLAALGTIHEVKDRTVLIEEGMLAEYQFNVTAGTVKLYRLLADGRCQIIGFAMTGDFIGLERGGLYLYSAEAITGVTVCRFRRGQILAQLATYPHVERQRLAMMEGELIKAQDQIVLLGRKTASERMASMLLILSTQSVLHGHPGNPIALPMTRGEMADYLGLTTETVSRSLTKLKRDGIIALIGNHLAEVLDFDRLVEASGEVPSNDAVTACAGAHANRL